jgi:hypothetical protein
MQLRLRYERTTEEAQLASNTTSGFGETCRVWYVRGKQSEGLGSRPLPIS